MRDISRRIKEAEGSGNSPPEHRAKSTSSTLCRSIRTPPERLITRHSRIDLSKQRLSLRHAQLHILVERAQLLYPALDVRERLELRCVGFVRLCRGSAPRDVRP